MIPKKPRPRGPSYGPKKLKPVGVPRRTGSIELSRMLEKLDTEFRHQPVELPWDIQAELKAIKERNSSGTWTKADLARVEQIKRKFLEQRKRK